MGQHHGRGGCGKTTHGSQRGIQVFIALLHRITTIAIGFALEFIVGLCGDAPGWSEEDLKEELQWLEHKTKGTVTWA